MARLVANRDGGTSNEYGTFAALSRFLTGNVFEGFAVVPNGTPNMTVLVNPGSGVVNTGTYPSSYSYFVSHDTVGGESVTIATAAASPRIDYIVAFVNKSVTPSAVTTYVNNTNAIFNFASVAGTPAGSPLVPTVAQIQTAVGAANPYFILAQVAVGASVTTITTPNLTDNRSMVSHIPLVTTTYANSGSAGGTFFYKVEDGIKKLWGYTNTISFGATSGQAATAGLVINFPSAFFTAITGFKHSMGQANSTNYMYSSCVVGPTTSSVSVGLVQTAGGPGNSIIYIEITGI
jgi:hypothetical protein